MRSFLVLLLCAPALCVGAAQSGSTGSAEPAVDAELRAAINVPLGGGAVLTFVWIEQLQLWVGEHEITNGQYRRYDPEHDLLPFHGYSLNGQSQPAAMVSWQNAQNYCAWLNRHFIEFIPDQCEFRLPNEEEWEAFAGCGDGRVYPWGHEWPPPSDWNYRGEEGSRGIFRFFVPREYIKDHADGFIVSCPVDKSGVNSWGLYGVGGNVWEWCEDWFDSNKTARVIKGASWRNYRRDSLAIANRESAAQDEKTDMIGFRVVVGRSE